MNNKNNPFLGCIGFISLTVLMIAVSSLINGWALSLLWSWFVVPTFGLPPLSIVQAIGIALVARFIVTTTIPDTKDKNIYEAAGSFIGISIIYPVLAVGMGWLISGLI